MDEEVRALKQTVSALTNRVNSMQHRIEMIETPDTTVQNFDRDTLVIDVRWDGGMRAKCALRNLGAQTIGDVLELTEEQVKAEPNVGWITLRHIEATLRRNGFYLRMSNG
jgi:DNA-directed RNA polymerase alpha subunit